MTTASVGVYPLGTENVTSRLVLARLWPLTCDDVVQEGGGHAEDPHQEVAHGQVQDEQVGDRPHVSAPQDDEAHDSVAHHAHEEDEQVGHDEDGGGGRLVQVESHVGDVVPRCHGLQGRVVVRAARVLRSFLHVRPGSETRHDFSTKAQG